MVGPTLQLEDRIEGVLAKRIGRKPVQGVRRDAHDLASPQRIHGSSDAHVHLAHVSTFPPKLVQVCT